MLAGIILPYDAFGTHLNSKGETVDEVVGGTFPLEHSGEQFPLNDQSRKNRLINRF